MMTISASLALRRRAARRLRQRRDEAQPEQGQRGQSPECGRIGMSVGPGARELAVPARSFQSGSGGQV